MITPVCTDLLSALAVNALRICRNYNLLGRHGAWLTGSTNRRCLWGTVAAYVACLPTPNMGEVNHDHHNELVVS